MNTTTAEGTQAQNLKRGDKVRVYTYAGWTTETVKMVRREKVTESERKWWPDGRIMVVTDGHSDSGCCLFHPTDVIRMAV